ncbi:MAG: GNAT family N-acetyltransferase [Nitrososphaerota archaeon]
MRAEVPMGVRDAAGEGAVDVMAGRPGSCESCPWAASWQVTPLLASWDQACELTALAAFVSRVNDDQRPEGYRLVSVFEEDSEDAVAVIGFRPTRHQLYGCRLSIDDLITRAGYRRRGHGRRMMEWALNEACRLGCTELHLDSGPQHHDAHRLYLNQRMYISALHFRRVLE